MIRKLNEKIITIHSYPNKFDKGKLNKILSKIKFVVFKVIEPVIIDKYTHIW